VPELLQLLEELPLAVPGRLAHSMMGKDDPAVPPRE